MTGPERASLGGEALTEQERQSDAQAQAVRPWPPAASRGLGPDARMSSDLGFGLAV